MSAAQQIQQVLAPLFPGLIGVTLVEAGPERVVATMLVRADLCTTAEVLHGGAIMAFADTLGAIGSYLNLPAGARTTTASSSTQFIGAAPSGATVVGEATALHSGRTTHVWQTQVRTESGKLCAVVTQTQIVVAAQEPARAELTRASPASPPRPR